MCQAPVDTHKSSNKIMGGGATKIVLEQKFKHTELSITCTAFTAALTQSNMHLSHLYNSTVFVWCF